MMNVEGKVKVLIPARNVSLAMERNLRKKSKKLRLKLIRVLHMVNSTQSTEKVMKCQMLSQVM